MTEINIKIGDSSVGQSTVTIPGNRDFRNGWVLDGDVISEDLAAAKNLMRDKIRVVRKPLLEAQDIAYQRAQEASDDSALSAAVSMKNRLRDAPAAAAIEDASDIAELRAAWDTDLLGVNPFLES
jgi:hypothetical protein